MKRSEALAAGIRINIQTDLRRAGFPGDPGDIPAVLAFLRRRPMLDVEVPETQTRKGARRTLRPRQSQFRQAVFAAYGGKCALTGESCEAVLEAAHIRDKANHNAARDGILLRADLHRLLDNGLMTVSPDGTVRIQPKAGPNYRKLHGKKIRLPKRISDRPAL